MLPPPNRRVFLGIVAIFAIFNISYLTYSWKSQRPIENTLENTAIVFDQNALDDSNQISDVPAEVPAQSRKKKIRNYFDDRTNGFMIISNLEDVQQDEKDEEIFQLDELHSIEEQENFKIFEIFRYPVSQTDLVNKASEGGNFYSTDLEETSDISNPLTSYYNFQTAFIKFFQEIIQHLHEHKPSIEFINNDEHYNQASNENLYPHNKGRMPTYGGHLREQYKSEPVRTAEYLKYFLRLTDDEIQSLKDSHANYLRDMIREIPEDLKRLGETAGFMKGDGIVYLGGGKYNQLVMTSIFVLRSLGSKLPVQVIIPRRSDFDIDLCATVLPKLNGNCLIMEDFLPSNFIDNVGGFQLKNVAILLSSFKNVIYLDADNIPVKNPDVLFVNEPFKSSRMIMWPDLWRRSTSPLYYEIAGISVDTTKQARNSFSKGDTRGQPLDPSFISYHDLQNAIPEASSETGQMMIDKEIHFATLILALYYNFYGPNYYYCLLSQGAAGEGDKETFIAAAHKLKLPYYQVSEYDRELGPMGGNKKREYFGMGQYDPIIDYLQSTMPDRVYTPPEVYADDRSDESVYNYDLHFYKSYSLMFLHANWPKYYIGEMFDQNGFGRGPKIGDSRRRLYSKVLLKETSNFDFELHIMQNIESWVCGMPLNLIDVPEVGSERRHNICKEIKAQIEYLSDN